MVESDFSINYELVPLSMLHYIFQSFRSLYSLILFIIISFVGYSAASEDTSQKTEGLTSLISILSDINTFSGEFIQYSLDQKGVRIQESRGLLKAERSGKFFWSTEEPLEQLVVSNGNVVTVYDPDLEQATIQKMDVNAQTTPAIIFSGDPQKIGELFSVELRTFNANISQFLLTPKTKESLFDILRVRFEGKHLKELRITDALGQESTMSFVHSEINLEFPKSTFVVFLPEGTDVIRDASVLSNVQD